MTCTYSARIALVNPNGGQHGQLETRADITIEITAFSNRRPLTINLLDRKDISTIEGVKGLVSTAIGELIVGLVRHSYTLRAIEVSVGTDGAEEAYATILGRISLGGIVVDGITVDLPTDSDYSVAYRGHINEAIDAGLEKLRLFDVNGAKSRIPMRVI